MDQARHRTPAAAPSTTPTASPAAVAQAIDAGSNYYTLSLHPHQPQPGRLLPPDPARLSSPDAASQPQARLPPRLLRSPSSSTPAVRAGPDDGRTRAYDRAAMSRGAPTPQDLLFKVRVLPASNAPRNRRRSRQSARPRRLPQRPLPPLRRRLRCPHRRAHLHSPTPTAIAPPPSSSSPTSSTPTAACSTPPARPSPSPPRPPTSPALQHSALQCHLEISVPDRRRDLPPHRRPRRPLQQASASSNSPPPT